MLAQYAGIAAAAGVQLPSSSSAPIEKIIAILDSRRLRAPIATQFGLRDYYGKRTLEETIAEFSKDLSIKVDKKSSAISISVTNNDARLASEITNSIADRLIVIYNEINQSAASRERSFLESRVSQAEKDAAAASSALAEFQAAEGAIEIESQTKAAIEAIARFQGELIAQQIELRAMSNSAAASGNPSMLMLQERIKATAEELERLLGNGSQEKGVFLSLTKLPALGVVYADRFRAVKKQEALLAVLVSQLEGARISEARTAEVVTIIDRAEVPERKSGPSRLLIIIATIMLGVFIGTCFSLLRSILAQQGTRLTSGERNAEASRQD